MDRKEKKHQKDFTKIKNQSFMETDIKRFAISMKTPTLVDNIPCSSSFKKLFNKEVIQDPQNISEDLKFIMSFILLKNAIMPLKCPECEELS